MCVPCHACVLADELAVEGGRQLLQGVRPFSKVTAHKVGQPNGVVYFTKLAQGSPGLATTFPQLL
jgi:hypothetical protein